MSVTTVPEPKNIDDRLSSNKGLSGKQQATPGRKRGGGTKVCKNCNQTKTRTTKKKPKRVRGNWSGLFDGTKDF